MTSFVKDDHKIALLHVPKSNEVLNQHPFTVAIPTAIVTVGQFNDTFC